ncbi:hypothetical protein [Streptomyces yunnanensis]|uniref:Uncharacterized protein n=1 Tax=Streptomyces yunnanensis TaxID=156453 RepID=A0A9X8N9K3_9ACTN|nr:hypothetical protein [Streptomyces yunnanensis]SHN33945.1 hypothetical protein SAMN05216268_14116 [Streptomyces yunnanensis]
MSVVHERSALDRPVSLFVHAQRLSRLHLDVDFASLRDDGLPASDGYGQAA